MTASRGYPEFGGAAKAVLVVLAAVVLPILAAITVRNILASETTETAEAAPSAERLETAPSASAESGAKTAVERKPLTSPPDPGPLPDDHGLGAEDLASVVGSSVRVYGWADDSAEESHGTAREGSGFAIGDGDLIATSAHLITGVADPLVDLADGRKRLPGVVVAIDRVNDIAVLRVDDANLDPLPVGGDVSDGTVGVVLAWTRQAGSEPEPSPSPFRINRPVTVRTDIVAGSRRVERRSWLFAGRIDSGHSGAALVTRVSGQLEVVGIVWGLSRREGVHAGYATRADELETLLATDGLLASLRW